MTALGTPPILVEPVVVDLQLKRKGPLSVYVLDHDGRRTGKVIAADDGKIVPDGAATHAIYYEIEYP